MRRMNIIVIALAVACFGASTVPRWQTVFEGARLIVGNGTVIENATLVVDGGKITPNPSARR